EVQPYIASAEHGEILDQQTLTTRIGLPVQTTPRVTRLIIAQPLEIVGALATGTHALFRLVAQPRRQRQITFQRPRIDQYCLIQIDPAPGHQQTQWETTFHPQAL